MKYIWFSPQESKYSPICLFLIVKNSFIEKTYVVKVHIGIATFRQFQRVPTTYVTENKEENYLEIYIFQVSCPLSLPLLNIPNCQSVLKFLSLLNCLYLHDSYISKFEFKNYLFANMLVAWL